MKTSPPLQSIVSPDGGASRRHKRGVALVLVLGMLALIAVLVVAFLSNVTTELQSAKSYASGTDARGLADSAVNIVISQIQDATSTGTLAWASQPGMIRTYDNTGAAVAAYKLYSSNVLRPQGGYDAAGNVANEVPPTWTSNTSLFTDLNSPVSANGIKHYPIIDPAAVAPTASGNTALDGASTAIEGCYLDTTNAAVAVTGSQTNPLPMPVQWLYVLKSGSLVSASADPSSANTVLVSGASKSDPIVGRIAFWTDDETCKVNVNTASEGTYWDRPWADSAGSVASPTGYESGLAASMPVQNEFQRYPGHPATTSLSPIFPQLAGETKVQYNERIYGMIPRLSGGGSKSGTVRVTGATKALVPNTQRLFASVDEFLFQGLPPSSGTTRAINPSGPSTSFSQGDIERTRFFLTANSRAPEVNLFNKPRITLWPLQANTADVTAPTNSPNRNAADKLIAFCSTIGSGGKAKPYYFQRYNTYDPAKPNQLPAPSSQSPVDDWNNIPRNQELYQYLQSLTAAPIPGLGGSLSGNGGKFTTPVRDQILTEMMDFVRSEVNTYCTSGTNPYYYTPFNPSGGFVTGQGQIVPLVITPPGATYSTKGFGRFPTIIQAAIVLYRKDKLTITGSDGTTKTLPDDSASNGWGNNVVTLTGSSFTYSDFIPTTSAVNLGAVLILQPFHPTPGSPPWSPNVSFVVNGLEHFTANGHNMGFPVGTGDYGFSPAGAVNLVTAVDSMDNQTALNGLELFFQQPVRSPKTLLSATSQKSTAASLNAGIYPFCGNFQLTESGSTFTFSGETISVDIYPGILGTSGSLNQQTRVQRINMNFPQATLPVPTYARWATYAKPVSPATTGTTTIYDLEKDKRGNQFIDYSQRLSHLSDNGGNLPGTASGIAEPGQHPLLPLIVGNWEFNIFDTGDTVRSVETRYAGLGLGDYRMIAGLTNVPEDYFEGHGLKDTPKDGRKYSSSTSIIIHSLRINWPTDTSNCNGFYQGFGLPSSFPRGKLVPSANYLDPNGGDQARNATVPAVPFGLAGAFLPVKTGSTSGDWDTGSGYLIDGPFINKADEANSNASSMASGNFSLYYALGGNLSDSSQYIVETGASFSPNRQIASAVAFGSLPAGIDPSGVADPVPWRTLLFCANPAGGSLHPGFGLPASGVPPYTTPPDHAFLDLFTMPIVEPYAISDPFSTAGKVNMNYQIVPFTYLTRDTAVRAVLKSTNIMAVPASSASTYKWGGNAGGSTPPPDFRYTINPDEIKGTLAGFESRWTRGDIFRSASEICDIFLVPKDPIGTAQAAGNPTYGTMSNWWSQYLLTGDNVRESPYGNIYPRLTTKSNTYTVHVRTQALKKSVNTDPTKFVDGKDQVTGEFRGSFVTERYLDPNSDSLIGADGKTANETDEGAMVGPYKYRILSSKRFAP
jgi:uncharacterized protein (TIGR02600 family)